MGRRGQAIVELSFILAFLGGIFLLAFDYGRGINIYLVVAHAAREAARTAALEGATTAQIRTAAETAAADFVAASALTVTCNVVTISLSTPYYTLGSACPSPQVADATFRVTVSTVFTPLVPFVGFAAGGGYAGTIPISQSVVGLVLDEP